MGRSNTDNTPEKKWGEGGGGISSISPKDPHTPHTRTHPPLGALGGHVAHRSHHVNKKLDVARLCHSVDAREQCNAKLQLDLYWLSVNLWRIGTDGFSDSAFHDLCSVCRICNANICESVITQVA
jgi:hypothetical protein